MAVRARVTPMATFAAPQGRGSSRCRDEKGRGIPVSRVNSPCWWGKQHSTFETGAWVFLLSFVVEARSKHTDIADPVLVAVTYALISVLYKPEADRIEHRKISMSGSRKGK